MTAPNVPKLAGYFAFIAVCTTLALGRSAHAQGEPFYNGKTVRIIVGFTPGGFYDRWARLLSRTSWNMSASDCDCALVNVRP